MKHLRKGLILIPTSKEGQTLHGVKKQSSKKKKPNVLVQYIASTIIRKKRYRFKMNPRRETFQQDDKSSEEIQRKTSTTKAISNERKITIQKKGLVIKMMIDPPQIKQNELKLVPLDYACMQ